MKKYRVLFIGAFKKQTGDGGMGGQIFACRTLIESNLKKLYHFHLIDTTAVSIPAPPVYKRLFSVLKRQFQLFKFLMFYKVDIVIAFSSNGASFIEKGFMLLVARAFSKKTILAPRSGLIQNNYYNSGFYHSLIPLIVDRVDNVICQNELWKVFYESISNSLGRKFIIIQNWIDYKKYEVNESKKKNEDCVNILYIGWIEVYKGVFDLVDALELLENNNVRFKLKIYGSGSKKDELQNKISALGLNEHIELCGWADLNIKLEAFAWSDIFVQPSHAEGFPNTILEALASGVPVVATKIDGINDLIDKNDCGILVRRNNPEELAKGIETIIADKDLREKVTNNGLSTIRKNHSVESAVKKWDELISSLILN